MRAPLVGLALLLSLTACGGGSSDSTGPGVGLGLNGTYTLKAVDNKILPGVFADSSILSGELVMSDSGWTQKTVVLYKAGGSAAGDTLLQAGFWAASGSNLTLFDLSNTTTYTGTYSSTGISLTTKTSTVLSYGK